jgi:hypothetical protein
MNPFYLQEPTIFASILITTTVTALAASGFYLWRRESHRTAEFRIHQERQRRIEEEQKEVQALEREERRRYEDREREERRFQAGQELERRRLDAEEKARVLVRKLEEERITANASGPGSGGYIVVDLPDKARPCSTTY